MIDSIITTTLKILFVFKNVGNDASLPGFKYLSVIDHYNDRTNFIDFIYFFCHYNDRMFIRI